VAGVSRKRQSMPPQRRAGSTEMRLRIGVLIWYPSQREVCAISVIGGSAGKQGWGLAEGVKYTLQR
jgi:hypothetical protein